MPVYLIIKRREFEQLFETVESNGVELTAVNAKTTGSANKRSRISVHRTHGKKVKKREQSCSPYSSRSSFSNKNQSGTTKCIGTHSRTVDPSTGKTIITNTGDQSDSEPNSEPDSQPNSEPEAKFTGRVCRSEGVEYTSTSSSE